MSKYKVYNKEFAKDWGQDLEDFLDDPTPDLYHGYHEGPGRNIEAVQHRCWASLARLITLLAEKGVISLNEALRVVDVNPDHDMNTHEIRENKDDD